MAREKKPVHKVQMTDGKRNIIQQLLQEYDIQSAEDIQDALKDLLGGTIKEMMEAEMDEHLGYENQNVRTRMIIVMVISLSASIAAMAVWTFKSPRTVNPRSSRRWSKNARKISPISTRRLFLCMPKA
mgnify:CR=1 FL=1